MQQKILYHGKEAADRILELTGLSIEVFRRAAQIAYAERANCNMFDPTTTPGTEAWRHATRYVRHMAFDLGYRLDDPKNLPLVISDALEINITVSSGDDATGLMFSTREPKTKNPKGAILGAAVRRNLDQEELFPELVPTEVVSFGKTAGYPTWVFLIYVTDEEIRAELSLPSSMDGRDHINGWSQRVIIPVTPPDDIGEDFEPEVGPDILPEVSFKI